MSPERHLSPRVACLLVAACGAWLACGHCRSDAHRPASATVVADGGGTVETVDSGGAADASAGEAAPVDVEAGGGGGAPSPEAADEAEGTGAAGGEAADAGDAPESQPAVERGAADTATLPALLEERGFVEPAGGFLAYVIAIRLEDGRSRIAAERRYDYRGTSEQSEGWHPASMVKLYAAIGALRRIRELGYDRGATLTYRGTGEPQSFALAERIEAAIGPSDNLAYDYLVTFAGFDRLHRELFTPENGIFHTALRIPYDKRRWENLGFSEWLRDSPAITVEEDGRTTELVAEVGHAQIDCSQGSCTTPADLGETMRRVMLHKILPEGERLGLRADDVEWLRGILASVRERGMEVVEGLRPSLSADTVFFHKAGYAGEWFSDNVYIDDPTLDRTWVVVLAGNPGRSCLDQAAKLVGELLAEGRFDP